MMHGQCSNGVLYDWRAHRYQPRRSTVSMPLPQTNSLYELVVQNVPYDIVNQDCKS